MSGAVTVGSAASSIDAPHFLQVGEAPVFIGAGQGDLVCRCRESVLISNYLPQSFLSIRIKCFRCGAVSLTPGLPGGEILPPNAVAIEREPQPVVTPNTVPRSVVLACAEEVRHVYALTQPCNPPADAMVLSAATLEATAAEYDRLTGGSLAEHTDAARRSVTLDASAYPLAWALLRLRDKVASPEWSWLYENDDAMAAMHIAAMQHWLDCWGLHPGLDWFAASLTAPGQFLRTLSVFATAKLLFDSGNRVGFAPPAAGRTDLGLHFSTGEDAPAVSIRSPPELQWRERAGWSPRLIQTVVADTLAASQGEINLRKPGLIVLPTSILQPDFDQTLVDGIKAVFQSHGRKHRGVAAIAVITPKVAPAQSLDRVRFFYGFYPMRNPRFAGENPIRLGSAGDFAPRTR